MFVVDEDGPGLPAAQTPASAQINGGEMSASNTIAEQCPPPRTPATASEMLPPSRTPASLTASARLNGGTPASSTVSGPFPPPRTPAASSTTSARVNSVDTPASSTISGPIPGPTVPETEGDSASGTCFSCIMNIYKFLDFFHRGIRNKKVCKVKNFEVSWVPHDNFK